MLQYVMKLCEIIASGIGVYILV